MKRSTATGLILLFLSISTITKAQDNNLRFGIKGSANICWIKPDSKSIEKEGTKLGFSYGLMGDFYFAENYAFSTELLITHYNFGMTYVDTLFPKNSQVSKTDIDYEYKTRYVQVPLSIKFKTKEIGYVTYWAQFGVAPSFLIRARADIVGADDVFDDPTDIHVNDKEGDDYHFANFDDKISPLRIPLIVGAGIEYNLSGNTSLYAGLRMDNGFTNIFGEDKKAEAISNFVSINAGFFF